MNPSEYEHIDTITDHTILYSPFKTFLFGHLHGIKLEDLISGNVDMYLNIVVKYQTTDIIIIPFGRFYEIWRRKHT